MRCATETGRRPLSRPLMLTMLLGLAGCSAGPETGPGEVRWDAVTCERCVMAVSDRHFSAQVRGAEAGRKTRLHFFDDIGCAVIWLQGQSWRDDPRTEIWVNDAIDGAWRAARDAHYAHGFVTPMDFDLGAMAQPAPGSLTFTQAVQEILLRESRHQPRHPDDNR